MSQYSQTDFFSNLLVPEAALISVGKRRAMYRTGALLATRPNWKKSAPKAYIAQAAALDERTGGRFRKTAKAMKKWRWKCKCADAELRLKSFHLEQAVTRYFQNHPDSSCFTAISAQVRELPTLVQRPQFRDLADNQCFIDEYVRELTGNERDLILHYTAEAQESWRGVELAQTKAEVIAALDKFFGISAHSATVLAAAISTTGNGLPLAFKRGLFPDFGRDPGEEFLTDHGIPVLLSERLKINAKVTQDGFQPFKLLGHRFRLKHKKKLEFYIEECSVPEPFDVKWKVKNIGDVAERRGMLRGQVLSGSGKRRGETTDFFGDHYVQCYIIKDGVCVAAAHIDVPIE